MPTARCRLVALPSADDGARSWDSHAYVAASNALLVRRLCADDADSAVGDIFSSARFCGDGIERKIGDEECAPRWAYRKHYADIFKSIITFIYLFIDIIFYAPPASSIWSHHRHTKWLFRGRSTVKKIWRLDNDAARWRRVKLRERCAHILSYRLIYLKIPFRDDLSRYVACLMRYRISDGPTMMRPNSGAA